MQVNFRLYLGKLCLERFDIFKVLHFPTLKHSIACHLLKTFMSFTYIL